MKHLIRSRTRIMELEEELRILRSRLEAYENRDSSSQQRAFEGAGAGTFTEDTTTSTEHTAASTRDVKDAIQVHEAQDIKLGSDTTTHSVHNAKRQTETDDDANMTLSPVKLTGLVT